MSNATESSSPAPVRRQLRAKPFSLADRMFFGIARGASYLSVVLIVLILVFLLIRAYPALQSQGIGFIFGSTWNNSDPKHLVMQIAPMLWGSVLISILGILLGVPMALSAAYFIEFMAGKTLAKVATLVVDLLAALPSIVIGLWGLTVFTPIASHWAELLNNYLGFIPIFKNTSGNFASSPFIAGWIIAVMIVPIITSISREIFSQMDRDLTNASLALGGSRASTFFKVVLPTASGGVVGGILLGLGRALGETVAIYFVLSLIFKINWFNIIENQGGSVASMILAKFGEAGDAEISGLMAAGLVLFVVTLLVNWIAAYIVNKAQPWRKL
jgi:phosphate transport system permease protein